MKPPLFVDQEVGGSIPPNRTNIFNNLDEISQSQLLFLGPMLGPNSKQSHTSLQLCRNSAARFLCRHG